MTYIDPFLPTFELCNLRALSKAPWPPCDAYFYLQPISQLYCLVGDTLTNGALNITICRASKAAVDVDMLNINSTMFPRI